MIRILHLTQKLSGTSDGRFEIIRSIIAELPKKEFKHIFIHDGRASLIAKLEEYGIVHDFVKDMNCKIPFATILRVRKLIDENGIEVIHCHSLKAFMVGCVASVGNDCSIVYDYQGLYISSKYYPFWLQIFLRITIWVLIALKRKIVATVPSMGSKTQLLAETSVFKRVEILYLGSDFKLISEYESQVTKDINRMKQEGFKIICFAGRLHFQKRFDRCLRIFEDVSNKVKAKLVVFGDGEDFEKYLLECNGNKNIHLFGHQDNIPSVLKHIDILLMTSDYEGFPLVVWECMAVAKPIISTDVGGIREVIEEADCGETFAVDDEKTGVSILLKYLGDNALITRKGLNGYNLVKNKYRREHFAENIANLYRRLV